MRRKLLSMRRRETIFQAFDKWGFDEKGWSPTTRRKYAARARASDEWLTKNRGVSVVAAAPKDLKAYLFSTSATARNRNNIRQALIGFGEFLVATEVIELNASLALPRLPEPESIPKALDVAAARRVAAAASSFGAMAELLILLFLYGGLRRNEARLLEWRHVDPDGSWLRFRGKGAKERTVPAHERLQQALVGWRAQNPDPQWVFPSPRGSGRPISETHLRVLVWEVGEAAGVPFLHPHILRHTFATRLMERGAHLRECQIALGHSDPKTTAIYDKVRPPRLRYPIARLDF